MTLPARVALTARRGQWPRRWLCALRRGHRWRELDGWFRFSVTDGEWRVARGSDPILRCAFCSAQEPWESDPIETSGTFELDQIFQVPRIP